MVGLGKVGLPVAVQYALTGHEVVGLDVNPKTVELVNLGVEPFPGEELLRENLATVLRKGTFKATLDYATGIRSADVVVVLVPLLTSKNHQPDFVTLEDATRGIGENLSPGSLVIYETTLPVGTTRGRWAKQLEEVSGMIEGGDFHVAFSPERVYSGSVFKDLGRYPKIVGGLSNPGESLAVDFYHKVLDFDSQNVLSPEERVIAMGSAEAAEFVKLAETTYRDVNIGLANQFAKFADREGINLHQVIAAANSQPSSHIHQPGVAVGGHCIPVYPHLYLWNDESATIVKAARKENESMPAYAVGQLAELLGGLMGTIVLILGASYRGGVKETAYSGVFSVVKELEAAGATAYVDDPLFDPAELKGLGLEPWDGRSRIDALILQSDHEQFTTLTYSNYPGLRAVYDGRRGLSPTSNFIFRRLGDPSAA